MGTISYAVPVPGTDMNSVADPEIATALTTLLTLVNGNIDTNNINVAAGITGSQLAPAAGITGSQLAPAAGITAAQVAAALAQSASVNQAAQTVKGAVNIAASQSTGSTTYTTLSTPDQVTGIVLPTSGLIAVWYQALWAESVAGAARAAIFLGGNQIQVQGFAAGARGPQTQAAATGSASASVNLPLVTYNGGLVCAKDTVGYTVDISTGQIVGAMSGAAALEQELGGIIGSTGAGVQQGGPLYLFAAAGTYTVSVQFKTSSGIVSAAGRKLWVQALSFS